LKNLQMLKRQIVEVGRRTYERGYVASNDGNISARADDNRVVITPTGVSKGFMNQEDMVLVDMNGKVVSGSKKPSSEVFMHLQVYKDRPDVNSVCHAHPPYATGFAVAGIPLDQCVLPEVIIALGNIPIVEYGTPGTEEFYKPVVKLLPDYDAFLLANHGALTVGSDVLSAYHKMETLEHFAHIAFVARQLGHITTLSTEQVKKLTDLRSKYGIRTTVGCVTCETEGSCDLHPEGQETQAQMAGSEESEKERLIREITEKVTRKLSKA
jgi:L-fuculose-phosphate aldolase